MRLKLWKIVWFMITKDQWFLLHVTAYFLLLLNDASIQQCLIFAWIFGTELRIRIVRDSLTARDSLTIRDRLTVRGSLTARDSLTVRDNLTIRDSLTLRVGIRDNLTLQDGIRDSRDEIVIRDSLIWARDSLFQVEFIWCDEKFHNLYVPVENTLWATKRP